jgi:hypothetical protein
MSDLVSVADAWEKQRRGNDAGTYIIAVAGDMVRDALVLVWRRRSRFLHGNAPEVMIRWRKRRAPYWSRGARPWALKPSPPPLRFSAPIPIRPREHEPSYFAMICQRRQLRSVKYCAAVSKSLQYSCAIETRSGLRDAKRFETIDQCREAAPIQ